jgi:protein tyrosine/serine phosphatase
MSLMLAASLVAPVAAKTPTPNSAAASAAMSHISIDNFGQVNANYYRGAQPKGGDFADLKALGVRLVIDLAKEGDLSEATNVEAAGMKFVRIPMTTDRGASPAEVDQFLKLVNDPANQPVYVHCMGGRHRTGELTAVYRMSHDGWTADQAFSEMKNYKFGADFLHSAIKNFVYAYYANIRQQPKVLVAAEMPAVR